MRPHRWSLLLVPGLTVALAACGGGGGGSTRSDSATPSLVGASALPAVGKPVDGGTLRFATDQEPDCLDPHVSPADMTATVDRNVVDSLVAQAPDGKIVPWLAASWKTSPDLRTYTFTLRKDVTFQDGAPLDAAAVKANLDHIAAPATKSQYAVNLLGPYTGSKVIDAHTLQVGFKKPNAPFLQAASTAYLGILSPKSLAKGNDALCNSVVGSGPFSLAGWTKRSSLTLKRNPDYKWPPPFASGQGPAHLDEVVYRFLPDDAVRLGALTSGQADLVQSLPPRSVATVKKDSKLQFFYASVPGANYNLFFNNAKGVFADENVRVAFQRSLDLDALVKSASDGQFQRGWSLIGPATVGYDAKTENSWPYDQGLANQKLDSAGWKERDSAGYRTKDGKRLVVDWLQPPQGEQQNGPRSTLAQLIQASVKQIGIQLKLDPVPIGTYLKRYTSGEYDLADYSFVRNDPDILRLEFSSATRPHDGIPNQNVSLLADPTIDKLFAEGSSTLDVAKRAAAYAKVQEYLNTHAVSIPGYVPTNLYAARKQVQGLVWDAAAFPVLQSAWIAAG